MSEHTEFLKQALITLLVKDATKSPDSMNNLRPISLLDTIKRLVGRIITDRLSKAVEAKGVYTDLQFGFRHHHSTKMAIARLHASFHEARARRSRLVVAYLDFSNMYCTIPHALIQHIMTEESRSTAATVGPGRALSQAVSWSWWGRPC